MSWLDGTTPEEKEAIKELKKRTLNDLSPKLLEDESIFYRFLKARDFNVQNAEAMLRKHIEWRKEWKMDTFLEDFKAPEVIEKYNVLSLLGFDKAGSVVHYMDYGGNDLKGFMASVRVIELIKYAVWWLEKDVQLLKEQSKKVGKPVITISYIYNFENLTFSNALNRKALQGLSTFAKLYMDNYPERLKHWTNINVATPCKMIFSMLIPILPVTMQQKMKFFSSVDRWQDYLLQHVDKEVLPAFLGGTLTDPDGNPRCNTLVKHGKTIPKSYYFENAVKKLKSASGVKRLNVSMMSKEEVPVEVREVGSQIEWEFETMCRDIEFAVYFRDSSKVGAATQEIMPKQRIDTCYEPEEGLLKCEKPGTYILQFDNSYSWIFSKDIYYRVRIRSPQDQ